MAAPDTYYQRHRDACLAKAKTYYQENKEHYKLYNAAYYRQIRRVPEELRTPPKPKEPKVKLLKVKKLPTPPPPPSPDKRKLPREYSTYEQTLDSIESELAPYKLPPHKIEKYKEICPQGWLKTPEPENPFFLVFK